MPVAPTVVSQPREMVMVMWVEEFMMRKLLSVIAYDVCGVQIERFVYVFLGSETHTGCDSFKSHPVRFITLYCTMSSRDWCLAEHF